MKKSEIMRKNLFVKLIMLATMVFMFNLVLFGQGEKIEIVSADAPYYSWNHPEAVIDGNYTKGWGWCDYNIWLRLDLGDNYMLSEVNLYIDDHGWIKYYLKASVDNVNWETLVNQSDPAIGMISHSVSGTYKYLEVYIYEIQYEDFEINEVEVFGAPGVDEQGWTDTTNNVIYRNLWKVGIGTDTPTEKLDVNGNVKAIAFIGDGSQLTNLPITTTNYWSANGSDIYRSSGNVGIGVASPSFKLHVSDRMKLDGAYAGMWIENGTSNDWFIGRSGSNLRFYNNGDRITITPAGNMGIGTHTPNTRSRLDIVQPTLTEHGAKYGILTSGSSNNGAFRGTVNGNMSRVKTYGGDGFGEGVGGFINLSYIKNTYLDKYRMDKIENQ